MANIKPNIDPGTNSLSSPLITPGWPMAVVPASDPLMGEEEPQLPDPINDKTTGALYQQALVQSGHTSDRVI